MTRATAGMVRSYEAADRFMGPLAVYGTGQRATRLVRVNGSEGAKDPMAIAVRFYDTDVVTFYHPDRLPPTQGGWALAKIETGGFVGEAMATRINEHAPEGVRAIWHPHADPEYTTILVEQRRRGLPTRAFLFRKGDRRSFDVVVG